MWSENPGDIVNLSGPDKSNSNSSEKGKYKFSNYVFLSTFYAQSCIFLNPLKFPINIYKNIFTIKKTTNKQTCLISSIQYLVIFYKV